ncbi:hypothetical protein DSL72_000802 [Monilinia vaccinii-corymbosi]|uniref:CipC-like antibiotic response protein n=1 Tax=Monilinia vaccinii-corymbosi TaxID=61207 RepID=A0A8A3P9S0_9HELO|nr:hypothetical protein DSL72_000802 [Monilinia vaccinii-corymbosi]
MRKRTPDALQRGPRDSRLAIPARHQHRRLNAAVPSSPPHHVHAAEGEGARKGTADGDGAAELLVAVVVGQRGERQRASLAKAKEKDVACGEAACADQGVGDEGGEEGRGGGEVRVEIEAAGCGVEFEIGGPVEGGRVGPCDEGGDGGWRLRDKGGGLGEGEIVGCESQDHYDQYQNQDTASLGHEVLAGGAGFAAMKMFEDRQRKEGKPVSHAFAKELIAGFAAGEIDKLAETKGEDWVREHRMREKSKEQAEHLYDQHYGQDDQYDPNQRGPPEHLNKYDNNY